MLDGRFICTCGDAIANDLDGSISWSFPIKSVLPLARHGRCKPGTANHQTPLSNVRFSPWHVVTNLRTAGFTYAELDALFQQCFAAEAGRRE